MTNFPLRSILHSPDASQRLMKFPTAHKSSLRRINGEAPKKILYLDKVQEVLKAFPTFTIQQVPRAENAHVDALASLGLEAPSRSSTLTNLA
ncbi:hypothetical protein L3X38_026800 [Prunus dulcis]|uniref:RNase H type-1 domain-containing protein n=1 Tax=Prunus dulcis TaxID=3755 RepID=A0AAD4VLQ5_PRUDU|nr:hypothetical protein L3X38_026800 [Prunus dulcis]